MEEGKQETFDEGIKHLANWSANTNNSKYPKGGKGINNFRLNSIRRRKDMT